MALEIATLNYETRGREPRTLAHDICSNMRIRNEGSVHSGTGRAILNVYSSNDERLNTFKEAVKAYRKGNVNQMEIKFPTRIGKVAYITTIPTHTYLNILFRHDSCLANSYDSEGDHHDTHYQPQVYFIVKVDLRSNMKSWKIVQSPLSTNGRMFPHNESSSAITNSCCTGDYTNQVDASLRTDNLGAFLTLMSMFITDGTRESDEYGRSCHYFTDEFTCDREVSYRISNSLDVKLLAYTMSDPEVPHGRDVSNQMRSIKFMKPEFQNQYIAEMCKLNPTT